jgi:hypothetical protein
MENENDIRLEKRNCPNCGRECTGKRGYAIHLNKCNDKNKHKRICQYCNEVFCSHQSRDRHYSICIQYHLSLQKEEYERKIKLILENNILEISNVKQEAEQKYDSIKTELTNKIMNIDQTVELRVLEEKQKMMLSFEKDIIIHKNHISKLEIENESYRSIISNMNIISNIEKEEPDTKSVYLNNKIMEYVYIIQEREFVKEGRPLYKIGRTTQKPYQRFSNYPKGSIEFLCMNVPNCKKAEAIIKNKFNTKFKVDRDIGVEYFEGDIDEMKKEFINLIDTFKHKQ